ncbi:18459_t:CDS:1, partial [Racocetra persica]
GPNLLEYTIGDQLLSCLTIPHTICWHHLPGHVILDETVELLAIVLVYRLLHSISPQELYEFAG